MDIDSTGALIVSGLPGSASYLRRISWEDDSFAIRPIGIRPSGLRTPPRMTANNDNSYLSSVVDEANFVHVYDPQHVAIIRYTLEGALVSVVTLPDTITLPLVDQAVSINSRVGSANAPFVAGFFSETSDGRLLLTFSPGQPLIGIIISPGDYRATPILRREASTPATDRLLLWRSMLVAVSADGVRVFRLRSE